MHLATRAAPFAARDDTGAVEFRTPAGASLTTREPVTKAALRALAEKTPGTLSFDELLVSVREEASGLLPDGADVRQALAQQMLQCYGADIVELHCTPPVFAREAEERPHGDPVARLQAERGLRVTNLLHESITLDDASRRLLTLLDGRASRAEIARTMWPAESAVEAGSQLDRALQALARLCLLVR
jgi:methyltransferase-like protein